MVNIIQNSDFETGSLGDSPPALWSADTSSTFITRGNAGAYNMPDPPFAGAPYSAPGYPACHVYQNLPAYSSDDITEVSWMSQLAENTDYVRLHYTDGTRTDYREAFTNPPARHYLTPASGKTIAKLEFIRTAFRNAAWGIDDVIVEVVEGVRPPTIPPRIEEIEVPDLPFFLDWLEPLLRGLLLIARWFGDTFITPALDRLAGFLNWLRFLEDIKNALGFWLRVSQHPTDAIGEVVASGISTRSPEWASIIEADAHSKINTVLGSLDPSVTLATLIATPPTHVNVAGLASRFFDSASGIVESVSRTDLIVEAASLGQVEGFGRLADRLLTISGIRDIGTKIATIPYETSILELLKQRFQYEFTPYIPTYQDLIEMVVKEIMTVDDFKVWMKYMGYNEVWSQRIWDKHFYPPTRLELNRAFWRGKISEGALRRLQILVDLDPRYRYIDSESGAVPMTSAETPGGRYDIWRDLIFSDPTLSEIRFMYMFGKGTVTPRLDELIGMAGVRPEWTSLYKTWIKGSQSYFFRRRVPTFLGTVYQRGDISGDEVRRVLDSYGFDESVAEEIIRLGDLRRQYPVRRVVAPPEKITGTTVLRLYSRGLITRDQARGWVLDPPALRDVVDLVLDLYAPAPVGGGGS